MNTLVKANAWRFAPNLEAQLPGEETKKATVRVEYSGVGGIWRWPTFKLGFALLLGMGSAFGYNYGSKHGKGANPGLVGAAANSFHCLREERARHGVANGVSETTL